MNKRRLRTFLMVLLALTVTQVIVWAQDAPDNSAQAASHEARRGIEGVWDVSGTAIRCDTGDPIATYRAMNMFIRGGTLTVVNPVLRVSSSLGTWRHLGGRSYTAVFRLFRFNADDSFAGRSKVTRNVELSEDADEFTTTGSGEAFNADDELIGTFCFTETATRLE